MQLREKRRRGRMHKVLGDVSLMAGSPKDALNNYKWVGSVGSCCRTHVVGRLGCIRQLQ